MDITEEHIQIAEALISCLDGVEAVKINTENGAIAEVHIMAKDVRSAKQIVRDVESICAARLGISLDHKKISVAQIQKDMNKRSRKQARLRIVKTEVTTLEDEMEITVALAYTDQVREAKAKGKPSSFNRIKLMVEAGLKCSSLFLHNSSLTLEHIRRVEMDDRSVLLVSVTLFTPQGEDLLLGSAFSSYDPAETALKAALDAINRRFTLFALDHN